MKYKYDMTKEVLIASWLKDFDELPHTKSVVYSFFSIISETDDEEIINSYYTSIVGLLKDCKGYPLKRGWNFKKSNIELLKELGWY
jgi:hypothetical protein|tara:strand:- start:612 stop:869 length:258 start_codon:yes stop_codon:yes gene_type:complete